MAAEMAVEITAQEEIQTEDRHQTVQEDHLQVAQTAQEDHSERVTREELTETVHREGPSVRVEIVHREGLMEKAVTVQEEASTRVETVHREELTVKVETVQEDHA